MESRNRTFIPILLATASLLGLSQAAVAKTGSAKPVSVFPSPGTLVASDSTTFSFRNIKPGNLGPVRLIGSLTGVHRGSRLVHSDGKGVSVVPNRGFAPGEWVRVSTRRRIRLARHGDFRVRIGRFFGLDQKSSVPAIANRYPRLHSRPDLKPPTLDLLTSTPEAAEGRIFFAPKLTGMTIADKFGRISWFRPSADRGRAQEVQDFRSQQYRGKSVLTFWKGTSKRPDTPRIGSFNILNRRYQRIARFGVGNGYKPDGHEFTISPRNTALVLAYRAVRWDLRAYGGLKNGSIFDNVVQEIDIGTGAVLFEWHSAGNVGLGATVSRPDADNSSWDYFHVNSVDADADRLLVSARKVSTIYSIDRATGQVKWRLRGDGIKPEANDFRMGTGARFGYQHDAERLPNGDISLFDNGSAKSLSTVRPQSSGLILRLLPAKKKGRKARAILVRRFAHPDEPVIAGSQGSTEILANGNAFIGWGSKSRITEFTADGSIAFDATFEQAPVNSYRAHKAAWQGVPPGRPAIASKRGSEGKPPRVWASWNGANQIAAWVVVSGPGPKKLKAVASSAWRNLETRIPVPRLDRLVRAIAYDQQGKKLGQSAVVKVGRQSG